MIFPNTSKSQYKLAKHAPLFRIRKNFNNLEEYSKYSRTGEITGGLTLFDKMSMSGPMRDKEHYDEYVPIHYVYQMLNFKYEKKNPTYDDKLFFFVSETGSGKTTAFVVGLYRFFNTPNSPYTNKDYFEKIDSVSDFDFKNQKYQPSGDATFAAPTSTKNNKRIIVTQPKVVTAIEKARELSSNPKYYPGMELGKNIGYKTGDYKLLPKDENGIIFATLGSLTAELMSSTDEDLISKYNFILIDECHERLIELDFVLVLLKKFLKRNVGNPELPIVIFMSATFDYKKYMRYFGSNENNYLFVKGTSGKYDVFYSDNDVTDIYTETYKILEEKVYNQQFTADNPIFTQEEIDNNVLDILIFLPGGGELSKMQMYLEKQPLTKDEIYQKISSETFATEGLGYLNYNFEESKNKSGKHNASRRIILSTSVVETGLTIPTIKWVIDIAFQRTPEYNPVKDFGCLLTKPASKSSIIQRRGRTGREFPGGIVHCLYTKETFDMLPDYNLPDVYISYSGDFFLKLLNINIKNPSILFDKLDHHGFINFINECFASAEGKGEDEDKSILAGRLPFNPRGIEEHNEKSNCLNTYNLGTIKSLLNKIIKINTINEASLTPLEINYKLYPPKMLDNYADVSVMSYLQKIKSLGFLGTYLGYIASQITGITLEAKRLAMLSYVWKISFNDMVLIATFASIKRKDYIQLSQSKKFKYRFSSYEMFKEVCKLYPKFGNKFSPAQLDTLVCDEFIEPLILVTIYKHYLSELKGDKTLSSIESKLTKIGVVFKNFISIVNMYYNILDDFKRFGFEERFDSIDLFSSVTTFADKLAAIKKCISSAYKNNIILYDGNKYVTQKGVVVGIEPKFSTKTRPIKLVYSSLFMNSAPDSIMYTCTADKISVLDGYC